MEKFQSVDIKVAANIYYDGQVTSRAVEFSDGTSKTLGIMLPGEYEFNTGKPELMEVTAGQVSVQLKGADNWQDYSAGESFNVPGNSSFKIKVKKVMDYICSFLED